GHHGWPLVGIGSSAARPGKRDCLPPWRASANRFFLRTCPTCGAVARFPGALARIGSSTRSCVAVWPRVARPGMGKERRKDVAAFGVFTRPDHPRNAHLRQSAPALFAAGVDRNGLVGGGAGSGDGHAGLDRSTSPYGSGSACPCPGTPDRLLTGSMAGIR